MALWTDPSRQFLIQSVRNRAVLWDKSYTGDQNYRNVKSSNFMEVTHDLNAMFPMSTKFSCEDVRSQWKNLKDTFVRKLRWVTEGKYSEDPTKEPTWKFYRMLCFLDDKEMKRLNIDDCNGVNADGNVNYNVISPQIHRPEYMHMKNDPSIHYEHSNHSATSSEEQMLQMFSQNYEKPAVHSVSPPSPSLPMPVSSAPCSTETICAKPPYTSPSNQQPSNSNHIDDEDEPRRKRMCEYPSYSRRQPISNGIPAMNGSPDEFDLFGACVAAQLKRLCDEHSRGAALRLQKKLNDILFADQIELLG